MSEKLFTVILVAALTYVGLWTHIKNRQDHKKLPRADFFYAITGQVDDSLCKFAFNFLMTVSICSALTYLLAPDIGDLFGLYLFSKIFEEIPNIKLACFTATLTTVVTNCQNIKKIQG